MQELRRSARHAKQRKTSRVAVGTKIAQKTTKKKIASVVQRKKHDGDNEVITAPSNRAAGKNAALAKSELVSSRRQRAMARAVASASSKSVSPRRPPPPRRGSGAPPAPPLSASCATRRTSKRKAHESDNDNDIQARTSLSRQQISPLSPPPHPSTRPQKRGKALAGAGDVSATPVASAQQPQPHSNNKISHACEAEQTSAGKHLTSQQQQQPCQPSTPSTPQRGANKHTKPPREEEEFVNVVARNVQNRYYNKYQCKQCSLIFTGNADQIRRHITGVRVSAKSSNRGLAKCPNPDPVAYAKYFNPAAQQHPRPSPAKKKRTRSSNSTASRDVSGASPLPYAGSASASSSSSSSSSSSPVGSPHPVSSGGGGRGGHSSSGSGSRSGRAPTVYEEAAVWPALDPSDEAFAAQVAMRFLFRA